MALLLLAFAECAYELHRDPLRDVPTTAKFGQVATEQLARVLIHRDLLVAIFAHRAPILFLAKFQAQVELALLGRNHPM